jgi:hypothetical protein
VAAKYFVDVLSLSAAPKDETKPVITINPISPDTFQPISPAFVRKQFTVQVYTSSPELVSLVVVPAESAKTVGKANVNPLSAQPNAGVASFTVTPTVAGNVTLHAIQVGYSADQPLEMYAQGECEPSLLPPPAPASKTKGAVDPAAIIAALGNPYPYSFQTAGKNNLLVYSALPTNMQKNDQAVKEFKETIKKLGAFSGSDLSGGQSSGTSSSPSTPAYSVRLRVPHAAALGDPATLFSSLAYPDFTIQKLTSDRILITAAKMPDCKILTAFFNDLRRLIWETAYPQPPVHKLFFLGTSDVLTAINGSGGAAAGGGTAGGSATGGAATGGGASGGGASPSSAASPAAGSSGAAGTQPASAAQGGSSATPSTANTATAAIPAGSTATAAASISPAASGAASTGAPSSTSASKSNTVSAAAVGADQLVFSVAGEDPGLNEKKRILALLDLPRPEMLITAWSVQVSSSDSNTVQKAINGIRKEVNNFNDGLEQAINRGWSYLVTHMPESAMETGFYNYLGKRFIAEAPDDHWPDQTLYEKVAQRVLFNNFPTKIDADIRKQAQPSVCDTGQYCLGYNELFRPLKPRLTDLLLAVIAFNNPASTTDHAIDSMEVLVPGQNGTVMCPTDDTCDCKDWTPDRSGSSGPPTFYLECFREKAAELFGGSNKPGLKSQVGLLRAALANFLYHYKLSQQFPHEFSPYDLSQSAQALNSALSPLVTAFNRDLANYQIRLLNRVSQPEMRPQWFGGEKASFASSGLITVRTVSGSEATVNTTSQSFLDATEMPSFSDLLKSVANASGPAAPTGPHLTDLLQNITPIQAQMLMGVAGAIQSSKVQIGRGFTIDVTPRSLSGASAAEIGVTIKADESGNPTYFSGPKAGSNVDISRVASHDTVTRVRVDSIKLFDVSTLTAVLGKSRSRFPLLPPLVEIPYIGTVLGIPLPPAKEYHSSTAVLGAVVIPTAADLAADLHFERDRVLDASSAPVCGKSGPCKLRGAGSAADLDRFPIYEFHKAMVACLAEERNDCGSLSFDKLLLRDASRDE